MNVVLWEPWPVDMHSFTDPVLVMSLTGHATDLCSI